jgi:hypothetical protein
MLEESREYMMLALKLDTINVHKLSYEEQQDHEPGKHATPGQPAAAFS